MTTKEAVPVMFRVGHEGDTLANRKAGIGLDVYALFPTLPGTNEPYTCACYQHVGQHSSADFVGCVRRSRPAKAGEYADLLSELTAIYHDSSLKIIRRASGRMKLDRIAALRRPTP